MWCMVLSVLYFTKRAFLMLLFVKAISNATGIVVVKHDGQNGTWTNALSPKSAKMNFTAITDNNVEVPKKIRKMTFTSQKPTVVTSLPTKRSVLDGLILNSSYHRPTTNKLLLSTMPLSKNHSSMNFTTISPTNHHAKTSSSKNHKVWLYIFVPLSAVLLLIVICFVVRHIQKVKRKRRLERELIHQYSYPNSEAGDDDQERLFEVESMINTHFLTHNDQEEKNFDAEIARVSVAIGEGAKLVIEEESPLMNEMEPSTSLNC